MNKTEYLKAANILYKSRINNLRLNSLPINLVPKNENDAYSIQNELKILYLYLKENYIIGKKIGCTNKNAQEQLLVNEPFYGNLFSRFSCNDKCELNSKDFSKPFFEPEISFKIKHDINISEAPFTELSIVKYIDKIICSVEIIDFRFNEDIKKIGIYNLISNNAASVFWIKSINEFSINTIDLSDQDVKVYINNKMVESGNTSNVLGNPINALVWLTNKLASKGEILLKNNYISTGTCTKAIMLEKDSKINIEYGKLGNIKFDFI